MSLDALSSNELFNFIIYDTISANPISSGQDSSETAFFVEKYLKQHQDDDHHQQAFDGSETRKRRFGEPESNGSSRKNSVMAAATTTSQQGKKKRKRKAKVCKNKEEAETQRMTHIAVERNRRKQMNEHLAVLRSLMPETYVQRGDQASIVGGAVEFVKELEHLLSTLEANKLQIAQQQHMNEDSSAINTKFSPPFSQFFMLPQYNWSQFSNKFTSKSKASTADIEVTLIETHANLRILSRRSHRQLLKLIAGFQALRLTILHLNLTNFNPFVLYSISAKVEEGCQLRSVDDIAAAIHHMLRIIEEEALLC